MINVKKELDLTKLQHLLLASILAATTVTIGCRNETASDTQPASTQNSAATAPATATVATAPYDLQFIDMMSKHHQGAIDMAKMAQGKVESSGVKTLVKNIPTDQQKQIDQMKSWRDQWYPGAAIAGSATMPGMGSGMNMDMGQMQSMKAGPDFDRMFIDMMVPHHESAVAMSRDALARAEHPEIKTLAQQIIDAQTKEIDQMKKWRATMGKGGDSHKP